MSFLLNLFVCFLLIGYHHAEAYTVFGGSTIICNSFKCPSESATCTVSKYSTASMSTVETKTQCLNANDEVLVEQTGSEPKVFAGSMNSFSMVSNRYGSFSCQGCNVNDLPEARAEIQKSLANTNRQVEEVNRRTEELTKDLSGLGQRISDQVHFSLRNLFN